MPVPKFKLQHAVYKCNDTTYLVTRKWDSPGAKPQPDEFEWEAEDYDGPEDKRCGVGTSLYDVVQQIMEVEESNV